MMHKEKIIHYINEHCIIRPIIPMYGKLPGSIYYSQYILSSILYDTDLFYCIGEEFNRLLIKNVYPVNKKFQLAGSGMDSIALAIGLQRHMSVYHGKQFNVFSIREKRKDYGLFNYIEGKPNDNPVLLVDSLCNSTGSFLHSHNVLSKTAGITTLPFIFAVFNKEFKYDLNNDKYLPSHKALYIVDKTDLAMKPSTEKVL